MHASRNQPFRLYRLDRLSAVAAWVGLSGLLLAGCGGNSSDDAAPMSRVAAVKARPGGVDPSKMCGTFYPADRAPSLKLPPLEAARPGESVPAVPRNRWVWINLWATWCGPCRREMPLIESWRAQLGREGVAVDVWYVSVDEDRELLSKFLRQNPKVATGTSLRLTSMQALDPWLRQYGLDATQAIPIHLIVGPGGQVRCSHVGELRESDYPLMRELLR